MNERACIFDCDGDHLVGVLAEPAEPTDTAVLVVVGGPQVRCGSHRQFVQLARALAEGGVAVLRFDVRGMGDSGGTARPFEAISRDIRAALDALCDAVPGLRRVVLWGLCDGASAALLYLYDTRDARVHGLVLLNPWVRSPVSLARTHVKHYYAQRLRQRDFWTKLLGGGVAKRALADLASNLRVAAAPGASPALQGFQARMRDTWARFDGPVLLVLSENDYTAKEFAEYTSGDASWRTNLAKPGVTRVEVADADHTFSNAEAGRAVEAATLDWLRRRPGSVEVSAT